MEVSDEVLRPALEVAFAVAVAGQRLKPKLPPPAALRPYLKFQKLPNAALPVVRRVVDDDDVFRGRVAQVATEELAGRIGVLWLVRPEGWETKLGELLREADAKEEIVSQSASLGQAKKRQEAAEQAAVKARGDLAAAREELERERTRRQELEAELQSALADLDKARAELEKLRQLELEQRMTARDDRRARDEAFVARRDALDRLAQQERLTEQILAQRAELETRVGEFEPLPPVPSSVDRDGVGSALARAAAATERLAAALADAANSLHEPSQVASSAPAVAAPPASPARRATGRRPLPLPGGVQKDDVAAAEHLLRSGALVVIDGYNVAKLGWPDRALVEQRDRLLDALEDLVRRVGTRVLVVFDGADVEGVFHGRRLVGVRFTPAGTSADDHIRAVVAEHRVSEPIIVVTNDQAIRTDVAKWGANLMRSEQLLAVAVR